MPPPLPLDRDRDANAPVDFDFDPQTKAFSSSQQQQSLAAFEPSQPFPPLEEDVEFEDQGEGEGGRDHEGVDGRGDRDEEGDGMQDGEGDSEYTFESRTGPSTVPLSFPSESEEEDEDEDEEDEGHHNDNANRIGMNPPFFRSTGSLPGPNAFAPPFYNRPPTPLPPSPSLTSLLRPSFSATTSRPSTPDTSENETPNDTEAAVAKSARNATTVPRASPKVPTYEYYGFVLYLASSLAFCKLRLCICS